LNLGAVRLTDSGVGASAIEGSKLFLVANDAPPYGHDVRLVSRIPPLRLFELQSQRVEYSFKLLPGRSSNSSKHFSILCGRIPSPTDKS